MTFRHPLLGEVRVEAVEAEHDDATSTRTTQCLAPTPPAKHEADRPQRHGQNAGHDRGEQREERTDQREAGARSHIGLRRIRCYEQRCTERGDEHDDRQRYLGSRWRKLFAIAIQLAVHHFDHAIDVQVSAEEVVQTLRECARLADGFVIADGEKFHVAFDFHEDPDVREVALVVRAGLVVFDRIRLLATLQHHVLRRQHFAEIALAKNHLVVVLVRQRLQQVRDHLDRLAARLREPRLVLLLLQPLDALDFEIAQRIVFVGAALAVRRHLHAAGLQHAHHHRRAGAGQAGHDDHGRAELPTAGDAREQIAHSTYPRAFKCSSVSGSNS